MSPQSNTQPDDKSSGYFYDGCLVKSARCYLTLCDVFLKEE
jgi:hypothetical protein